MIAYIEADVKDSKYKTDIANLIKKMGYPILESGWRINESRVFYYLENVTDGDKLLRNLITQAEQNTLNVLSGHVVTINNELVASNEAVNDYYEHIKVKSKPIGL